MILKTWKDSQQLRLSCSKIWLIIRIIWKGFEKSGLFYGECIMWALFLSF